jgi:DNA-binding GntR family transcriptional regulator
MKNESQALKAYEDIRRKILTSQMPPGTRLKEDFWAKKLEVSRIAIREALTRLLGEGLVTLGKKGGFFIGTMTAADIHEIRELREILELGALRLAIAKMTRSHVEALEKICDDFSSMVSKGYFSGACEADIKFHETLVEFSGNEKLIRTYRHSHIPLFHQKLTKTHQSLNDYDLTDREHRMILKCLKEKNLVLAEKAMIQHFARGESALLED